MIKKGKGEGTKKTLLMFLTIFRRIMKMIFTLGPHFLCEAFTESL